jgi:hypothetical protein
METLTLLDTIIQDWKIIATAFAFGGFFWQAKIWFKKITHLLESTANTHGKQNIVLDNIHHKIDNLDKRLTKIEGSLEMVVIENHEQSVRLSVLETHISIDKPVRKRRQPSQ